MRRLADALLLLGDQVYADEVPAETRVHPRSTRHRSGSGSRGRRLRGVHDALSRVLVGSRHPVAALDVPSTMIFDDHDLNDDWNISQSWVDEMRGLPWWTNA